MGIFTNGYNGNGISGKIGNTVFFIDKDKQQAARAYVPDPENPRTPTQQLNRVKTIGVAKLSRAIFIARNRQWNLIKTAKGSYYNSIFKALRANPAIDFVNVGPAFGWAFTEYRTDPATLCTGPTIIWNGKAGICEFEIFNASIFIQDPLNPQWFVGVSFRISAEIDTLPKYDSQKLFITVISANWNQAYIQNFNFTRQQARQVQSDYLTFYVPIDAPQVGDAFGYCIGFQDIAPPSQHKRDVSRCYIQGHTVWNGNAEQFISNNFSFSEKYG